MSWLGIGSHSESFLFTFHRRFLRCHCCAVYIWTVPLSDLYILFIRFFCFHLRSQQLEKQTLSMVRGLSDQLRSACASVVSSAKGLPSTVQDQLTAARQSAEELYSSLRNTSTITPVLLERSRHQLNQVCTVLCCLYCSSCAAA